MTVFAGGPSAECLLDLLAPASDEVLSSVNKKRAVKVLNWLKHPKTASELLILCVCLRPVLSLMGFLFRSESSAAEHSVVQLMKPNNPAHEVLHFLLRQLRNLDGPFWALVRRGQWTTENLQLTMDTVFTLVCSIFWRVVVYLRFYPWALWVVVDTHRPLVERQERAGALARSCEHCRDQGFTTPLLEHFQANDLLDSSHRAHQLVYTTFRRCRATNIVSELQFARVQKQLLSSKVGRAPSISSVASKHLLSEFAAMHGRAVDEWERLNPHVDLNDTPPPSSKACSGWHVFFADHRGSSETMGQLGQKWRALDAEEKEQYHERALKKQEDLQQPRAEHAADDDDDHAAAMRSLSESTPLGIGDVTRPVRPQELTSLCHGSQAKDYCRTWRSDYGKSVPEPDEPVEPRPAAALTCAERYGVGCCKANLDNVTAVSFDACLGLLRKKAQAAAAAESRRPPPLQLLSVRGDDDDAAVEVPGYSLLAGCMLARDPEVVVFAEFCAAGGACPAVGDTLFVATGERDIDDALVRDVDIAMRMATSTHRRWQVKRWAYRLVASQRPGQADAELGLHLLACDDIEEPQKSKAEQAKADPVVAAALNLSRPPRQRATTATAGRRPRGKKAAKLVDDDPDRDPDGSADEDLGDPAPGSGMDSATDDKVILDPEDRELWHEAAAASSSHRAAVELVAPVAESAPAGGSSSSSAAAPSEPPPPVLNLPVKRLNGQVWEADGRRHLGRVSYLEKSPVNVAMCLYCRRHQCYRTVAGSKGPSEQGALEWLAFGWSRECATKAQHLSAFDRMVLRG